MGLVGSFWSLLMTVRSTPEDRAAKPGLAVAQSPRSLCEGAAM